MDIKKIIDGLKNCPCGRKHSVELKAVEIAGGLLEKTASILKKCNFPTKILVVADKNTLKASDGLLDVLKSGGFTVSLKLYDNFRTPTENEVNEIVTLSAEVDGVLSVGTGSLNDICRRASLIADKEFAIFATAPSMDGFASGTAPIIVDGIKETLPARQPSVIIADTRILANAPSELKSAGFGDIIGKYIALVDWRVASLLTGEYYCENIANLVRDALKRMTATCDGVSKNDEDVAGLIMEILILTGIAMHLANCSRPASGAEHQISHFIGMKQLAEGKDSDFHGKKVGVATVALAKIYHSLATIMPEFGKDRTNLEEVVSAYGERHRNFILSANVPSVCDEVRAEKLKKEWPSIQKIITEELPSYGDLLSVMIRSGSATKFDEISVDYTLAELALRYHSFMRKKVVLTRMLAMTDVDICAL